MLNDVMQNILTRRSVRAYDPKKIQTEVLEQILVAGSWAPTAMNRQSFRLTALQNPVMLQKLNDGMRSALLALEGSELSAYMQRLVGSVVDGRCEFLYEAPAIVLVSNVVDEDNGMADCALAMGNMMLAAHAFGVGSCWLNQLRYITDEPAVRELLDKWELPSDHRVYAVLALGYPKDGQFPTAKERASDVIQLRF